MTNSVRPKTVFCTVRILYKGGFMKFRHNIKKAIAVVVFCLFTVSGYAGAADWDKVVAFEPIDVEGIKPAQILEDEIRSGLDVIYYLKFFERHLKHLPKVEHSEYRSFRGKPILQLNHQFEDNKVFDSGTNRGGRYAIKWVSSFFP